MINNICLTFQFMTKRDTLYEFSDCHLIPIHSVKFKVGLYLEFDKKL